MVSLDWRLAHSREAQWRNMARAVLCAVPNWLICRRIETLSFRHHSETGVAPSREFPKTVGHPSGIGSRPLLISSGYGLVAVLKRL